MMGLYWPTEERSKGNDPFRPVGIAGGIYQKGIHRQH